MAPRSRWGRRGKPARGARAGADGEISTPRDVLRVLELDDDGVRGQQAAVLVAAVGEHDDAANLDHELADRLHARRAVLERDVAQHRDPLVRELRGRRAPHERARPLLPAARSERDLEIGARVARAGGGVRRRAVRLRAREVELLRASSSSESGRDDERLIRTIESGKTSRMSSSSAGAIPTVRYWYGERAVPPSAMADASIVSSPSEKYVNKCSSVRTYFFCHMPRRDFFHRKPPFTFAAMMRAGAVPTEEEDAESRTEQHKDQI